MCKHIAAVLYGVGARLDTKPELLFLLRGVNHEELIEADAEAAVAGATARGKSKRLAAADLSDVFGIEIDAGAASDAVADAPQDKPKKIRVSKKAPRRKPAAKRVAEKNGSAQTAPKGARKKAARAASKMKSATKRKASPAGSRAASNP
jgi:uncharacterized Zn finger protein